MYTFKKICILLVALAGFAYCQEPSVPKAREWVNDYASVIDAPDRKLLVALIEEVERTTSAEIAIVTLNTIGKAPIEDYAVDLFQKWGIGKKEKDNGILILLAINERKVRIEVGYGLEGIVPDGVAGRIIREKMTPQFAGGNFAKGLLAATATIANLIAKEHGVKLRSLDELAEGAYQFGENSSREQVIGKLVYFALLFFIFGGRFWLWPLIFGFPKRGGYWSGGRGGFGGFGGGGGFGGFGGGMSGGGGASGRW